jgi:L-asparagine transporter-like permease
MNRQNQHPEAHVPEEVTLSRDLGLFTITMIGVGGMIGAGIFVLTGIAAGVAGPALVLAFFLNGVVTLLTATVYAELGSAFPEAGGGYLWVKEGLGGAQGFLAGWMERFGSHRAGMARLHQYGRPALRPGHRSHRGQSANRHCRRQVPGLSAAALHPGPGSRWPQ